MSTGSRTENLGVLLLAGIGAGALTGILLGLMATRRPRAQAHEEITETVDDLRRRAEQILSELSHAASPPVPNVLYELVLEKESYFEPHDEESDPGPHDLHPRH